MPTSTEHQHSCLCDECLTLTLGSRISNGDNVPTRFLKNRFDEWVFICYPYQSTFWHAGSRVRIFDVPNDRKVKWRWQVRYYPLDNGWPVSLAFENIGPASLFAMRLMHAESMTHPNEDVDGVIKLMFKEMP